MAQTEHLGLHQWDASDSFLRTDFNEDFAKIDGAVGQLRTRPEVGLYTGNGTPGSSGPRSFDLGFTPRVVVVKDVTATSYTGDNMYYTYQTLGFAAQGWPCKFAPNYEALAIIEGGFQVTTDFNSNGGRYIYLAFA